MEESNKTNVGKIEIYEGTIQKLRAEIDEKVELNNKLESENQKILQNSSQKEAQLN